MSVDLQPITPRETPVSTEAKGIYQSDLLFRTGLILAIQDLRANPYLLDFCFAGLLDDSATADAYGARERDRAKTWFLRTDIPVVMDYNLDPPSGSIVSVAIVDSSEAENTLGDVHYVTQEFVPSVQGDLLGPLTPASYDAATGTVQLSSTDAAELVVAPGMLLVDRAGRVSAVLSVPDKQWAGRFRIKAGLVLDLTGARIRGAEPPLVMSVESLEFKEGYRVGCHGLGEAYYCTWLWSIISFALLRYKQRLFEARGLERTTMGSSPLALDGRWGNTQKLFTRFITLTGYVRNAWPKDISRRIGSVDSQPGFSKKNTVGGGFTPDSGFDEADAPWLAQDGTGIVIP